MSDDDLLRIRQVAEQKMGTLAPATRVQYSRCLKQWERFTKKWSLRDYDVSQVVKWHDRSGNHSRNAAFPVRCVEMVQALDPERVSGDFFVPQGLWNRTALVYREDVIPRETVEKVVACCIKDIEATQTLTRDSIAPFVVLMAIRSGMNVEPLLTLKSDCSLVNDDGRHVLRWYKGRSHEVLSAEFFPMLWGAHEIVQRVRALVPEVEEYLWAVEDAIQRPYRVDAVRLREWFQRHELRPFPLRDFRPAMATIIYEDTGDITAVRDFLHHKSIETTVLYIAEYAVLPRAEMDIANALDNIARKAGLL